MRTLKILPLLLLIVTCLVACSKEPVTPSDPNDPIDNPIDPNPVAEFIKLDNVANQSITGNLKDGEQLGTLEWAWNSSVACFVTPVSDWYTGNHVFYQIDLPTQSIITINLVMDDPSAAMSLYAYTKGAGTNLLPEELNSVVSCEADPDANFGSTIGNRTVELNATTNPYSVMIGVAGAEGLSTGAFTLEVIIQS